MLCRQVKGVNKPKKTKISKPSPPKGSKEERTNAADMLKAECEDCEREESGVEDYLRLKSGRVERARWCQ